VTDNLAADPQQAIADLQRKLDESVAQQAATSEILRVIGQSPTDTQPVFEAIVLATVRLLRCDMAFVMLCDPTDYWVAAAATPEGLLQDLTLIKQPIDPDANFPSRTIVEKRALYLPDWSLIELPEHERRMKRSAQDRGCICRCCARANASAYSRWAGNMPISSALARSRWRNPSAIRP
jgi:hypothetical protein